MTDYVQAAQELVRQINAPPQAHSVFIRTDVDEQSKEFKHTLCVSWHPNFKGNKTVPKHIMGYSTKIVPWPKGL
jgi:hypothetical protein